MAGLQGRSWALFLRRHLVLGIFLIMLVSPVAAVILGYITRPAPGTTVQTADSLSASSANNPGGEKKPKPAPGRPLLSSVQDVQPSVAPPPPPPALQPQRPDAMVTVPQRPLSAMGGPSAAPHASPTPPAPAVVPQPSYAPAVYRARHDKVFGEGCSGQLILDSGGLAFKCFDDPNASVQVALDDIESVDSNGVRLISGKKYHFSISGMAKNSEEELFVNWLQRVR